MRPCATPGCPALVDAGHCQRHQLEANRRHNAAPARRIYHDVKWRGVRGTRARALRRAGYRCEVVENGRRCVVADRKGRGLHAAHWPTSAVELIELGLDPFDETSVKIACDSHHARIDAAMRAARRHLR